MALLIGVPLVVGAGPGFEWGDEYAVGLLIVGISLLAAVVALSHERHHAFSASLIYLALGLGAAVVIEIGGIDWLSPTGDAELIEHVTELAVVIALFSTGLKLDRRLGFARWSSASRLLLVTMPLTIAVVALAGVTIMGLSVPVAIVLGAALAPTDPVLAGDIGVGPPGEEEEREPHFSITAEAGLNDGLALPFLILGMFLAQREGAGWVAEWVLADVVYGIAVGVGIGAAGGWLLAAVILPLRARRVLRTDFDGWLGIACVLVVYGAAELASAYGFLAAFVGGLAFRRFRRHSSIHDGVHEGAETAGRVSELAVLLLLGSLVTLSGLAEPGPAGWAICLALLFVIRPATVLVAFVRSRLAMRERVFLAWFGVRGVGSLNYVAVVLASGVLTSEAELTIFWTVTTAILLSVTLHGVTGTMLTARLLDRPHAVAVTEATPVREPRVRP